MKKPTVEQVIKVLREEIETYKRSYREADGRIRNKEGLHNIACLKEAVRILRVLQPRSK